MTVVQNLRDLHLLIKMMLNTLIEYSDEVLKAIKHQLPVVALESTIISHGMPYPQNIETALSVEAEIRKHGAIPATIAIHQGKIHVGLSPEVLEHFAKSKNIIKASRRDLSYVLSQQRSASTTVAATMICAKQANLSFFVTGGIGGVHKGAEQSFDISADLMELALTPINVICAGAKSILDLPKTLEYLETQGVPVITYQGQEFPAFYSRQSGLQAPISLNTIQEITHVITYQKKLGLKNGVVITTPIPEEHEIPHHEMTTLITQAHQEANHLTGKAITPFLLKRINELSNGRSLQANIELIKNNARLGAKLAFSHMKATQNEAIKLN